MFAAIGGFLVGVMASWWFLATCVILLIFADSDDYDDSIFWAFLAGTLLVIGGYFAFGLDWERMKWVLAGYIPLGVVWSFFKYRKYCTKQAKRVLGKAFRNSADFTFTKTQKRDFDELTSLPTVTGRVSYWILFWPLSIVAWAVRDLLVDFADWLINSVFKKAYDAVRNSAVKNVRVVDDEPKKERERDYSN
jgi:hypothetical protein